MFDRIAIKARAKEVLQLNLGVLIGAFAVAVWLPVLLSGGGSSSYSPYTGSTSNFGSDASSGLDAVLPFLIFFGTIIVIIATIYGLAMLVYQWLGRGAYERMSLMAYDGVKVKFNDILGIKEYWTKVLGLYLWMCIRTFLWSLLFIIPGIVAYYRYALAPYILFEDPSKSINQVIDESTALMKGYKGELFLFDLSFFWWWCLVLVTGTLAIAWVGPYWYVARAGAYRAIRYLSSMRAVQQGLGGNVGGVAVGADPTIVTQTVVPEAVTPVYSAQGAAPSAAAPPTAVIPSYEQTVVTQVVEEVPAPVIEQVVIPAAVAEVVPEVAAPSVAHAADAFDNGEEQEIHMGIKDTLEEAFVEPVEELAEAVADTGHEYPIASEPVEDVEVVAVDEGADEGDAC